jgi:hypothetical protein
MLENQQSAITPELMAGSAPNVYHGYTAEPRSTTTSVTLPPRLALTDTTTPVPRPRPLA